MTIKKWTPAICADTSKMALAALAVPAAEHGLTVKQAGNGRYDPEAGTFSFKLQFTLAGADPERTEFRRHCAAFGLGPADYGKVFQWAGGDYKLTGLHPNRPKWPVVAVRLRDGSRMKLPEKALEQFAEKGKPGIELVPMPQGARTK